MLNYKNGGSATPLLIVAIVVGYIEVIHALIAAGANINAMGIDGWTPLIAACRTNQVAIAELLLQLGADASPQVQDIPYNKDIIALLAKYRK